MSDSLEPTDSWTGNLFPVSFFSNKRDTVPKLQQLPWQDITTLLSTHDERVEKDGPLFSPAEYLPGMLRAKANVRSVSLAVMDIDKGAVWEEFRSHLIRLGFAFCAHSTYSHTEEDQKFRVVFPFSEPVPAGDWPKAHDLISSYLGLGANDKTVRDASRIYYLPSCPPGAPRFFEEHAGSLLDPAWLFRSTGPSPPRDDGEKSSDLEPDDERLLERMFSSKNGDRIWALWNGDISSHQSPSEADMALISHLAFFTGNDRERIYRLLRMSGLSREKWEREDYLPRTIGRVLERSNCNHSNSEDSDDGNDEAQEGFRYRLTDVGNAERFFERHGHDLLYCHLWKTLLCWDGSRWRKDETGQADRWAIDTVRSIPAEAAEQRDSARRGALIRWALRSESLERRRAMIVSSHAFFPVRPEEFDVNPWLLNCDNGTLDLKTMELGPHRREDRLMKLAGTGYDPDALCPTWERFLHRIMGGNQGMIDFLRKAMGYSLTGITSERVIFILYGSGANGKSTLLETVRAMMGDYALRTPTDTLLLKQAGAVPNDIARLQGIRFVTASETEEGRHLAEAQIKDLTGGETITARFMRAEWFDFRPVCKILLSTNHKPIIKGTDPAIWGRLRLIPFNVTIPPEERDKDLLAKLKEELPGILAWCVRGCRDWQREGLGTTVEVVAATDEYRSEMDVLGDFLQEICEFDPDRRILNASLWNAYQLWCQKNNEVPLKRRPFYKRMVEKGFQQGHSGERYWKGLDLKKPVSPFRGGLPDVSRQ